MIVSGVETTWFTPSVWDPSDPNPGLWDPRKLLLGGTSQVYPTKTVICYTAIEFAEQKMKFQVGEHADYTQWWNFYWQILLCTQWQRFYIVYI